jgi:hypothetical protein
MWVAVVSLIGLAVSTAVSSLATVSAGGWAIYVYSPQPPPLAMQNIEATAWVNMLLVPLAALSSAAYILRLDRDVRHGLMSRGFEVER